MKWNNENDSYQSKENTEFVLYRPESYKLVLSFIKLPKVFIANANYMLGVLERLLGIRPYARTEVFSNT